MVHQPHSFKDFKAFPTSVANSDWPMLISTTALTNLPLLPHPQEKVVGPKSNNMTVILGVGSLAMAKHRDPWYDQGRLALGSTFALEVPAENSQPLAMIWPLEAVFRQSHQGERHQGGKIWHLE